MKIRMLGATAIAALMVAIAAPATMAPLAFAQTTQAAPVLTKQMVKPYNEALQAIQAKDYATAQTKINEANAQAKTPVDKGQIERLKLQVAIDTKNGQQQVASTNALIASGTLTPEEAKQYKGALSNMYSIAGDEAGSLKALRAYVDEFNNTPDYLIAIADKALKQKDYNTAATYAEKAITMNAATGKPTDRSWKVLQLNALKGSAQTDKYNTALEQMAVEYQTEGYWRDVISRAQKEPKFSRAMFLDIYRNLTGAGIALNAQERSMAAEEAMRRGLPGEALALLEPHASELTSEQDKTNLASAKTQAASDKAGIAKETKAALTKGDPTDLAVIGEAQLTYGDNAKAVEVLKAAVAKGIADPAALAATKLHLGIAQYRSGDKAGAIATWSEVKTDDGAGMIAHNWTLIANSKP